MKSCSGTSSESASEKSTYPPDEGNFPKRITLELTNQCNLNCTFCPRRLMERDRGFMDPDLAKKVIREMAGHAPVTIVPFFRGESLLHPQWFEIISYMRECQVGDIQFTTNASKLTPECTEQLLDLNLEFISFSLDTLNPDLYEDQRKGANYSTTMENVHHFLKRRKTRDSEIKVQVSAVETKLHRRGMDQSINYWRQRVDRVRVYEEHTTGNLPGSIDATLPQFNTRRPCHKPFTDLIIYWNGEIGICNHDWTRLSKGNLIGSVVNSDIRTIWKSKAYAEIRKAHLNGNVVGFTPCDGCDHWKMYYMNDGFLGRSYDGIQT